MKKVIHLEVENKVAFFCPACNVPHWVTLKKDKKETGNHTFNFDETNPDISYHVIKFTTRNIAEYQKGLRPVLCESFIKQGVIHFSERSNHALSGQRIKLGEVVYG